MTRTKQVSFAEVPPLQRPVMHGNAGGEAVEMQSHSFESQHWPGHTPQG